MFRWLNELTAKERSTMWACFGGWTLDAMDVQIYPFAIPALIAAWGLSLSEAGLLGTAALVFSAAGGWIAGLLSDRLGRVRMLGLTILWYSFFTFLSGFTNSFHSLLVVRALQGLGFGGEWAVGAVLIGEVIRPEYRGRAVGYVQSGWAVGWALAALLPMLAFALFPADIAWRAMFWTGLLPGLLVFYIRRSMSESSVFIQAQDTLPHQSGATWADIFSRPLIGRTILATLMTAGANGGYYALYIFLPTFLKTSRNLSVIGTSGFLFVVIAGAFVGLVTAAHLSDLIGRRRTFLLMSCGAVAMTFCYLTLPLSNLAMLVLGFPVGFFSLGLVAPQGPLLTELFPTYCRGSGQGFCYNAGRGIAAFLPALAGYLSERIPLEQAIAVITVSSYTVVVVTALLMPETSGRNLTEGNLGRVVK